jgi:hypothetical protein
MSFEDAVADFPPEQLNTRATNVSYTFWHLLEHLRRTQWDILDYIRNPNYVWQKWPDAYWPAGDAITDVAGWNRTIQQFLADRQTLVEIIQNPDTDLYAQIPHGSEGHNILREIEVVGAHNAYHTGELGILRQVMGLWPANR